MRGEYPDYVKYPPNCIEFGLLCKACITSCSYGNPRLNGPPPGRDWRQLEVEKRALKLKGNPEWREFLEYAKGQPNTLELILEWSKK